MLARSKLNISARRNDKLGSNPSHWMLALRNLHKKFIFSRRVERLAGQIAELLPVEGKVIDIGCGDGLVGKLITGEKPAVTLVGYEVFSRPKPLIPVKLFDGLHLPVGNSAFDVVLLIDVLHHTHDPMPLLREAYRVARKYIIIKDHRLGRPLAKTTLQVMDWVGNRPHNVTLPYNFWREEQWRAAWSKIGLQIEHYQTDLGLYPWPASWVFELGLHFLAKLSKKQFNDDQNSSQFLRDFGV